MDVDNLSGPGKERRAGLRKNMIFGLLGVFSMAKIMISKNIDSGNIRSQSSRKGIHRRDQDFLEE